MSGGCSDGTIPMVGESNAVRDVADGLRERRLLSSLRLGRLWQWRRVRARRRIKDEAARGGAADELERIAVAGASAIVDGELRKIFQTHVWEPPGERQAARRRHAARRTRPGLSVRPALNRHLKHLAYQRRTDCILTG